MCTSIVAGGCWNTRSLVSVSVLSNTTSVTGEWQMAGSLGLMVMYGWLLEHRFSSASGVVVGCWNWNTGPVSQYRTVVTMMMVVVVGVTAIAWWGLGLGQVVASSKSCSSHTNTNTNTTSLVVVASISCGRRSGMW